jgi:hypothetical protein
MGVDWTLRVVKRVDLRPCGQESYPPLNGST